MRLERVETRAGLPRTRKASNDGLLVFVCLYCRCLLSNSRGRETSASTERTHCGHALEKLNSANMQVNVARPHEL